MAKTREETIVYREHLLYDMKFSSSTVATDNINSEGLI